MRRQPTIATVAEHAEVAVSTVSRYLNGHYVSHSAKQRIAKVIDKLGYTRSSIARNLSLGRTGSLGVVVDSTLDPWFVQLLVGIEEELTAHDTSLMLASLELRGHYDDGIVLRWIREKRVDGLILAKSQARERSLLRTATDAKIPTVAISPEGIEHSQIVRSNNIAGGATVADLLVDLGHRRIAFAGGPDYSIDSKNRLLGLKDRLEHLGVPLDPNLIFSCHSWEAEAGIEFGRALFSKPLSMTALVAANDALALGFMRVAQQRSVRIPQILSVVGFDDIPESALVWPGLTTVAQPMREMGRAACRKLYQSIKGSETPEVIEFPMELVVRESTGPPRQT